jgi:UDPglucose 6-dehydrogenase
LRLVETVTSVNDARKAGMGARIVSACGGSVRGRTIAVLGLTFKPETDDMRDAPSIPVIWRLVEDGARVRAYDPEGMEQARPLLPPDTVYCQDALDAAQDADALVLFRVCNLLRALSRERLRETMRGQIVIDLRNVYDPAAMRAAGFRYHGIGRSGR